MNSQPSTLCIHSFADGSVSTYAHHLQHEQHHHQQQHGSSTGVGRKVKNKLKSGLSTPVLPSSASPLDQTTSVGGVSNDFTNSGGGASASPANKLRGYQYFLVLYHCLILSSWECGVIPDPVIPISCLIGMMHSLISVSFSNRFRGYHFFFWVVSQINGTHLVFCGQNVVLVTLSVYAIPCWLLFRVLTSFTLCVDVDWVGRALSTSHSRSGTCLLIDYGPFNNLKFHEAISVLNYSPFLSIEPFSGRLSRLIWQYWMIPRSALFICHVSCLMLELFTSRSLHWSNVVDTGSYLCSSVDFKRIVIYLWFQKLHEEGHIRGILWNINVCLLLMPFYVASFGSEVSAVVWSTARGLSRSACFVHMHYSCGESVARCLHFIQCHHIEALHAWF